MIPSSVGRKSAIIIIIFFFVVEGRNSHAIQWSVRRSSDKSIPGRAHVYSEEKCQYFLRIVHVYCVCVRNDDKKKNSLQSFYNHDRLVCQTEKNVREFIKLNIV